MAWAAKARAATPEDRPKPTQRFPALQPRTDARGSSPQCEFASVSLAEWRVSKCARQPDQVAQAGPFADRGKGQGSASSPRPAARPLRFRSEAGLPDHRCRFRIARHARAAPESGSWEERDASFRSSGAFRVTWARSRRADGCTATANGRFRRNRADPSPRFRRDREPKPCPMSGALPSAENPGRIVAKESSGHPSAAHCKRQNASPDCN